LLSDGESAFNKMSKELQALVIVKEYVIPKHSVKIKINSYRRISESPLLNVKSLNYLENILARREASGSGFDEALFLNESDEVAECSTSNIFWFNRDTLFTPARECGLLSGTTRDLILSFITECGMSSVEGQFSLNDLIAADCVFITNSLIGCVPVTKVEGHSINPDNNLFNKIKSTLFQKLKWV
ncbi:MAG: aminotransferase class IV family protein, partial [Deltaproteobacteria bacterium]|nr:aminotransferase class IV family protein [Deltaproteobacteria bacterium]